MDLKAFENSLAPSGISNYIRQNNPGPANNLLTWYSIENKMMRINGDRLWYRLMEMAKIGATPKGGVCRVALTNEDKQGRDLFVKWCKTAGCAVEVDQMGNIFARRAGENNQAPAVLAGSHLDSQPTGGKFDGVYGVLAALEVVETLNDYNVLTGKPFEIVSWTNEEGARFAPGLTGSSVFAGRLSREQAYALQDKEAKTFGQELRRIGYMGQAPPGDRAYSAAFEIHIEQGPILENLQKPIGIVTGVFGIRWYDVVLRGNESHAGASPMSYRRDPVKCAVEVLKRIYELAEAYGPNARATIGYLDAAPGVRNTVAGSLTISVDFRHSDAALLCGMDECLKQIVAEACAGTGIEGTVRDIWNSPPVTFSADCITAVRRSVEKLDLPALEMISGAGHDAIYLSKIVPTSMIFIPCKDGLSHNELESAKKEEVVAGANVLLHSVLQMTGVVKSALEVNL